MYLYHNPWHQWEQEALSKYQRHSAYRVPTQWGIIPFKLLTGNTFGTEFFILYLTKEHHNGIIEYSMINGGKLT